MVDISVEILASSVEITGGHFARHRIKTWWAHVDVPPNVTSVELPRLPMIKQYLIMTGKDTTMFVETWQDDLRNAVGSGDGPGGSRNDGYTPQRLPRFIGITKCCVDEQLKNPNLNPSVLWLDVRDPIEDVVRGRLLLKIDARFALSEGEPTTDTEAERERNMPLKTMVSPRKLNFNLSLDEEVSPAKNSTLSKLSSAFSSSSVYTSKSQEQGVQTELSLPVLPDISKYTAALKSYSGSKEKRMNYNAEDDLIKSKNRRSKSTGESTSKLCNSNPHRRPEDDIFQQNGFESSEAVPNKPSLPAKMIPSQNSQSSGSIRKNLPIRQHFRCNSLENNDILTSDRNFSHCSEFENVEEVLDILNDGFRYEDSVFSSPFKHGSSTVAAAGSSKPDNFQTSAWKAKSTANNPTRLLKNDNHHALISDPVILNCNVRQTPEGSCSTTSPRKITSNAPERSNQRQGTNNPIVTQHRFREVHFDGNSKNPGVGLEQAPRKFSRGVDMSTKPPVIKRRIAAAIFNDDYM